MQEEPIVYLTSDKFKPMGRAYPSSSSRNLGKINDCEARAVAFLGVRDPGITGEFFAAPGSRVASLSKARSAS